MALFPSHTVAPGQDAFGYLSPDDLAQLRILARDKFVFARHPLPTVYRRLVEWKLARIIAVYDKPPYNGANFPYVDLKITEKGRRVYAAVQAWEVDDATRRQTSLFNPADHNAFVDKWQITYASGRRRGSYVGLTAARAAALRRLASSPLCRSLTKAQRHAVVTRFMAGPTRGITNTVLVRWLDAVEDAGFTFALSQRRA